MPAPQELSAAIAANVKQLRARLGWSLEVLAERSGVSRGMLVKIEQARVNPSVGMLVRIADAVGTNVARLIESGPAPHARVWAAGAHPVLWRGRRGSSAVLLGGSDGAGHQESWLWKLAPRDGYASTAHPKGTEEFLYVMDGTLTLTVGEERFAVQAGGSALFDASHPHSYRNEDKKRSLSLVMFIATPAH